LKNHKLLQVVTSSVRESLPEVVAFAEKLTQIRSDDLLALGEGVLDTLLLLLWEMVQQPGIRQVCSTGSLWRLMAKSRVSH
jgi:hypothetical protein